jgi:hypothetical protein
LNKILFFIFLKIRKYILNGSDSGVERSGLLGFGMYPLSSILKNTNTAFWKLDMFLPSDEGWETPTSENML